MSCRLDVSAIECNISLVKTRPAAQIIWRLFVRFAVDAQSAVVSSGSSKYDEPTERERETQWLSRKDRGN